MTLRYFKGILLLVGICSSLVSKAQLGFFSSLSVEGTYGIANQIDSKLPLAVELSNISNDHLIGFYPNNTRIKPGIAFGYDLGAKFAGGFYFAAFTRWQFSSIEFSGSSSYLPNQYISLGDYLSYNPRASEQDYIAFKSNENYPFSITGRRMQTTIGFSAGYRLSSYKTIRPFIEIGFGWGLTSMNATSSEIDHPDFNFNPDFSTTLSMDGGQLIGQLLIGSEFRDYRMYIGLSTSIDKESSFSSEDGNFFKGDYRTDEIGFNYNRIVNMRIGISRRFQTSHRKKAARGANYEDMNFGLKQERDVKKWEWGLNFGVSMSTFNFNSFIVEDIMSLRSSSVFIQGQEREQIHIEQFSLGYGGELSTPFHLGLYTTRHLGNWFLQFESYYRKRDILYDGVDVVIADYTQQADGSYALNQATYQNTSDLNFQKSYHEVPIKLNLGWRKTIGFYLGAGMHYLLPSKRFPIDENLNRLEIMKDFNDYLNGNTSKEVTEGNYLSDDGLSFNFDQGESFIEKISERYDSFEESPIKDINRPLYFTTLNFGISYTSRRLTSRMDIDFGINNSERIFTEYFGMGLSIQYMLFGR